ncbi:SDR family oxidoreductase [Sphingobium fluviale]|uniref:SDR family oxidoreductase n=1 Tax=Sphingobium fluviale TaxID=2506423 RepID=A0A4Q1KEL4_9SPHN|nr:SDR family oxidoreductase [Sphingobium fluviale]RXR26024.1 SDR family oxidoreductase [Sphingobium fluviale]
MQEASARRALITGASRGIGAAIARALARDGCAVTINYHSNSAAADALVADIVAAGGVAHALKADIADRDASMALVDAAAEKMGGLDILVCNAGVSVPVAFLETTPEMYDSLFDMTRGTFFAMQRASQVMADNGRIVAISTLGTRRVSFAPAYCASKTAIEQFCKGLAYELAPRGITVNAVLPGFTETDMLANQPEDFRGMMVGMTAMGRLGRPDDIAALVSFLVSADAGWVTAETISANGGVKP